MMKMKILVVDDAPYILKTLRDLLGAHGYNVEEAVNGEDALVKYEEAAPDVVLMDILMPKMDGISAIKSIIKYDANAKIIAITAMGKPDLEKDCIKAGARCFITKPFKTKDLLNTINSLGKDERN